MLIDYKAIDMLPGLYLIQDAGNLCSGLCWTGYHTAATIWLQSVAQTSVNSILES